MAEAQPRLSASAESPSLEVACLEEFWASQVAGGLALPEIIVKLLLDTIGLGNQSVYRFLHGPPHTFDQFCAWIVGTVGSPDPDLLSRYHAWLLETPMSEHAAADLAAIAAMEPVLDADALAFWDERGFVVVADAIPAEQVAGLRELIWTTVDATPDDPARWYASRSDGIMVPLFRHPLVDQTRRSPRIRKAFAQLWGSENLWVTIDRLGFNPPETESYRFEGSDIHWDVSLAQPVPFGTQGLVYLTDTAADQGAFRCVPGFHKRIDGWLGGLGNADPRKVDFSGDEVRVPGKAGDLVIWRQDLPHAASPNRSDAPRLVQYLNYYSPDMEIRSRWR